MKIQLKLMIVFVLINLILLSFAGIGFYSYSKNILKQKIYTDLEAIAQSRVYHIESFLNNEIERLKLISSRTQLRLSLDSYNKEGKIEDKAKMNKILLDAKSSISDFKDIFIINLDGKVIVSTDENIENIDYSSGEFFIKGKKGDNLFFLLDENDNPVIYLSGPLILEDRVLGVAVIVDRNINRMYHITKYSTGLGETGEIYLINKEGYMITPPRFVNNTFFKQKVDTLNSRNCFLHAVLPEESIKEHHKPRILKNYKGIEVLGTYKYIPEMQWCLLAEINSEEAFNPVSKVKGIIISIFIFLVILGIILSFIVSKTITKLIFELRDAAEKISKGSLNIKIKSKSKDEIGQLANSFNKMTLELKKSKAELEKYSKNLEEQVKSRTKELQSKVYELEKFNKLTIGREMRMVELKKRIKELEAKLKK